MATKRIVIAVPTDFFPPDHVRLGSRFSLNDTIGLITDVQATHKGASLRLTVEVDA